MARIFVFGSFLAPTASKICLSGASIVEPGEDWVWSTKAVPCPSCTNPPVENVGETCDGDPTSVVIRATGQPQCLRTGMEDCKFNMHDFHQLDFDVSMFGCGGTWAAPLWMTPDYWAGGGDSGEVDMLEFCPSDEIRSNFAGGGDQVEWQNFDTNDLRGHVTMWKWADADSDTQSIHVRMCSLEEANGGSCLLEEAKAYLHDIYGKNGCAGDGNCMYTLVSDIWNGLAGDAGYAACANGLTHQSEGCKFAVEHIKIDARAGTFEGKCAALATSSARVALGNHTSVVV